ncbi:gamma-secretase aspartyl protease complex, presenilin enhancer-2 subunit [Syncephalastrum racemosum]|uniref:Gamma-secretase aspartyl protease complex, presenilin enhancer-2 subunit n=1 Tax=Syncephalastrum racemosum TaxID=13706 RepID=A0A1X2HSF2_SYNRA|nr:gamma-secretase aspartyl protease complex, presenilin enhancer-2 subunit [Syncephalastrum racemosum]
MKPDELVSLCKKMFYGGLAFLPFLWLINVAFFARASRKSSAPPDLKKFVYMSAIGCGLWFIVLTTWYALFVNKRVAWGAAADKITVVIPKGV